MPNITLHEFIGGNRAELIRRCKAKVARRSSPAQTAAALEHGVPIFLDQLVAELRDGPSKTPAIKESAAKHGSDLLRQGFTVSQVVHDYGDVCQSVTDLAVETNAPISTDDFRTLNRCLDDAIAGAVTQHAADQELTPRRRVRRIAESAQHRDRRVRGAPDRKRCSRRKHRERGPSQPHAVTHCHGSPRRRAIARPDVKEHASVRTNVKKKR